MKKPKTAKSPKKKKPEQFGIEPVKLNDLPAPPDLDVQAPAGSVTADQPPTDGMAELRRLEAELSAPKKTDSPAQAGGAPAAAQEAGGGEPKPRRRRFKRPPPENTIRMTIRQYWRFRAWIANRKLQLPPEMFAAILEGADQTLVEPLVEPVVAVMDEYIPEEWISFIEEKSPVLTLLLALFEAEQTFASRISQIAIELRQTDTARPAAGAPQQPQRTMYPGKSDL